MHKLLERQVRKFFGGQDDVPPTLLAFLAAVDKAYGQADDDRTLLEHSMDVVSQELRDRYRQLGEQEAVARGQAEALRQADALRQSQRFLMHSQEVAHIGSWDWDVVNDRVTWTDELYRLFGLESQSVEMTYERFLERMPAEGRGLLAAGLEGASIHRQPFAHDHEIVRSDGVLRTIHTRGGVLADDQGRVAHVVGTCQDITDRKEVEELLRQAQKMEAVGQLAGGVAHDFNNLLTVISVASEILLDSLDPALPDHQDVRQIQQAATRAAQLTRQLLAFSRKQVLKPVDLDLNVVVLDLETMLRRLIGAHIQVATILEPALGAVKADPGQIEQVLMNLVVNARDAMPGGGTITIETSNVDADAVPDAGLAPGSYVAVEVRDVGSGMSAYTLSRIFEPFFTTKGLSQGTGLGLSTVYGIVKQSGGEVRVRSTLGSGTSFRVFLPRTQRVRSSHERAAIAAELERGSETILLVEDEESVRLLARRILERQGYRVIPGRHGVDALRVAGTHEGTIHLLLTDIVMPEMGGPELAERLLAIRPDMRVLYMSGYHEEHLVPPGGSTHRRVSEFIQKPFTSAGLAQAVRLALGARREHPQIGN